MDNSFIISSSHPCLAGHFPNNPIVPGVVILDEVSQYVISQCEIKSHNKFRVHEVISAKFLKVLKAEQLAKISLDDIIEIDEKHSKIKFIVSFNTETIAQGEFKLEIINEDSMAAL